MLSWPPWALAQSTRAPASGSGSAPDAAARGRDQGGRGRRAPSSSSTGRRSTPAPSPGRRGRADTVRGVWSGASTPSQRVIAWACGPLSASARGTPCGDLLRGERVVDGQQAGRPGVGQPVGAAVADPADDERAARRTTAATNVHDAGLPGPALVCGDDGLVGRVGGGDRAPWRSPRRGWRPCPCPAGSATASTSRAARAAAEAGHVGVGRRRDPVADDQHGVAARLGPGVPGRRRPRCGVCRTPRSQTAATHGAGCSVKWSRGLGAPAPHCVQ